MLALECEVSESGAGQPVESEVMELNHQHASDENLSIVLEVTKEATEDSMPAAPS